MATYSLRCVKLEYSVLITFFLLFVVVANAQVRTPTSTKDSASPTRPSKSTEVNKLKWKGPEMQRIEEEWSKMPVPDFSAYGTEEYYHFKQLEALLKRKLTKEKIAEVIESMESFPIDEADMRRNDVTVRGALAGTLIEVGDRKNLVNLFSISYPQYICYGKTEWVLVMGGKKSLKDPIEVLNEAYTKSKNAANKARIVTTLHESFDGLGIKGTDDDSYVKNAFGWYRAHKDRAVPSFLHPKNDDDITGHANFPLFTLNEDGDINK